MNIIGISGLDNSVNFKEKFFPSLSQREYRICQGLDSAAAIITQNDIFAASEERFSRKKGTGSFPQNAIRYCLKESGLLLNDIDCFAHSFDYESSKSLYLGTFLEKQFAEVYSEEAQLNSIRREFEIDEAWEKKFIRVPHHLAHAASSFYMSGFEESLILVVDAMGEQHSTTIALGQAANIKIVKQVSTLHSLGILYSVFTLYLGFSFNSDEYKVMGLAPYGNSRRYFNQIMDMVHLKDDGSYTIPILFENYTDKQRETYEGTINKLIEIFGSARNPECEITQKHMDIAASLQSVLETSLMHILRIFKEEYRTKNLCMAGGVALNCVANGLIKRSRLFKNIFIQPASGDDGSALGAAIYVKKLYQPESSLPKKTFSLYGPQFSNDDIKKVLNKYEECRSQFFPSFDELVKYVVGYLDKGYVIGWFQGRMEFGPRALGNRSILADPRDPEMRNKVNTLIKKRENFRPFAPAVTVEKAAQFFEIEKDKELDYQHMILVSQTKHEYREFLPAITHINGSARVQTVSKETNIRFWTLLNEFGKQSDYPVLLNTSFNVRGQPIVCTPTEAIDTFLSAKLDMLVMGDYVIVRGNIDGKS